MEEEKGTEKGAKKGGLVLPHFHKNDSMNYSITCGQCYTTLSQQPVNADGPVSDASR